ncbi:unnamed protein product [Mesocestoides corti]|uniref:Uncharacterized protein n=1 Tax=Mesocestoides corti TaxID=53468 RepID=A0A0R3U574_MESCO|nr:unnamed protein product [Mesocestoides corti]
MVNDAEYDWSDCLGPTNRYQITLTISIPFNPSAANHSQQFHTQPQRLSCLRDLHEAHPEREVNSTSYEVHRFREEVLFALGMYLRVTDE